MLNVNDNILLNPDNVVIAEQKGSMYKLTLINGKTLYVNSDVYEDIITYESGGGGGATYVAGNGITIDNRTINADVKVLNLQEGLASLTYAQALTLNINDIVTSMTRAPQAYILYEKGSYSDRTEYKFISLDRLGTYEAVWTKTNSSWSYRDNGFLQFPIYYGTDGISIRSNAIRNTRTLYTLNLDFGNSNGNVLLMSELNYNITESIDSSDIADMGEIAKLYNYLTDYNERIIEINNNLSNSSYIEVVKTESGDPRYGTQVITQTIYLKTTSGGSTTTLVEVSVNFSQRGGYSIVNTTGSFTISPHKRLFPKTL